MKGHPLAARALAVTVALLAGACATAPPAPAPEAARAPRAAVPTTPPAPVAPPPRPAPPPLPEVFESEEFVVAFTRPGDTSETLAARHLGDPGKAWMIEDYTGRRRFPPGERVAFPKRPWNPAGVEPTGYQLVPVLVYHNLGPQTKGRLVLGVAAFEQQMRYLKAEGYRVVSMRALVEFMQLKRQLPRKAVVLTFDDGYKTFREYASPILKELGFTATLFVYTDYVGAGRNALGWSDLRELQQEGFEVHAHSKTHGDLRRAAGESDADYARRLQAELAEPLAHFRRHLGRGSEILAFPYGKWDPDVIEAAKRHGYVAGFSVRRQGNPSFVPPLAAHRSQVYSEMSLEDFARNLDVWQEERVR
jgi:peptidoglycan/xylan/chitin deacetylase (PgdA/CDA1 family)